MPDDDATKAAEPKRARPSKRCPEGFEVAPGMADWAREKCPGVDVARETDKFRNHEFATARSDWPAAWRNWLYRAHDNLAKRPANRPLTAAERGDLFMAQIRGEPAHDDRRTIDVEATVHDHGSARIPFSG